MRAGWLLVVVALCGCESTQAKSARLERAAKLRAHATGLKIDHVSRDVTVAGTTVLQDANGAAAVVELRNRSRSAQVGLPLAVSVRDAAGKALYANDTAGLDASLLRVPALPAGGSLAWVDDQVLLAGKGRDAVAEVGAGAVRSRLPQIDVSGLKLARDAGGSLSAVGTVVNRSTVEQRRLVVFVVARRGARVVAAGRAVVERLAPGKSAPFTAFPIGDPQGAELSASAPPTVVP